MHSSTLYVYRTVWSLSEVSEETPCARTKWSQLPSIYHAEQPWPQSDWLQTLRHKSATSLTDKNAGREWFEAESDRYLGWNGKRALLTMSLTSGIGVSMPAFEPIFTVTQISQNVAAVSADLILPVLLTTWLLYLYYVNFRGNKIDCLIDMGITSVAKFQGESTQRRTMEDILRISTEIAVYHGSDTSSMR